VIRSNQTRFSAHTGLLEHLLGLNDLVNFCLDGIGLRINDINTRGAKPGDDQIAPLQEAWPVSGDNADEQAFQPKWWNSSPL
jgi:hypothetical protein